MNTHELPQVALVTGAGQGIGKGIALRLAQDGMTVIIADRDIEAAEEVAAELGSRALAVATDVAEEASVKKLMQSVTS
ncbi:MAG TPA: SDR family NAD(P)-dependent oxidoreductase, partial [Desulfuromonadales bacterium]|nr:SDR family NAD(P)-dependent oxidoreductase [Desulfuromonadales bacterium]